MKLSELIFHFIRETDDAEFPIATAPDVWKERLDKCHACDNYDEERVMCNLCGCNVEGKVKSSLESCPIGEWDIDGTSWESKFFDVFSKKVIDRYPEAEQLLKDGNN